MYTYESYSLLLRSNSHGDPQKETFRYFPCARAVYLRCTPGVR